jgi:hypothetical protein
MDENPALRLLDLLEDKSATYEDILALISTEGLLLSLTTVDVQPLSVLEDIAAREGIALATLLETQKLSADQLWRHPGYASYISSRVRLRESQEVSDQVQVS